MRQRLASDALDKVLFLPFLTEELLADTRQARALLADVALAVRSRIAVVASTPLEIPELPGSSTHNGPVEGINAADLVTRPELAYLLEMTCISSLHTGPQGAIYLTPIEETLAVAMTKLGIEFRAQVEIGRYRVDFLTGDPGAGCGHVVECDGRGFHDPKRDRIRDAELNRLGYHVIRFTGSQIFRDPERCAREVAERAHRGTRGIPRTRETNSQTKLTVEQQAAANHRSGPARVTAGAGAGKTRVVAERIRQLVREGADPERICSISYTRAAVDEMRNRLEEFSGERGVTFTTLHSLAKRITDEAGVTRKLIQGNIGNVHLPTRSSLVRKIVPAESWRTMLDGVALWVEAISFFRQSFEVPDFRDWEAEKRPGTNEFIEVCERYEAELQSDGLTDFEGLIHDAVRELARNHERRLLEASKFDYWIVDEYQDVPPAKLNLLRLLVAPARNLFVVGDEDQVIFGFAGANPRAFGDFGDAYPGFADYRLDINFRCPPEVVAITNDLISNNLARADRRITAAKGASSDPPVQVHDRQDYDEAGLQFVRARLDEGEAAEDIALLFRNTAMAIPVERQLQQAGIQYVRVSRENFFERKVTKRLLAWLQVFAAGRQDWPALVDETLTWPNRYVKRETRQACSSSLRAKGARSREAVIEVLTEVANDLGDHQRDAIFKYLWAIGRVRDAQPRRILDELNLRKALKNEKPASGQTSPVVIYDILYRLAVQFSTVDELIAWINTSGNDPDLALDDPEPLRNQQGRVMLSTIHKAKGREWPHVAVLGPQGGMPDWRAETDEQKEEERRLAYVAATRAEKRLLFCASSQYARELEPAKIFGPSRGGKKSTRIQPFGATITCGSCSSSFVTTGTSCPFCSADL